MFIPGQYQQNLCPVGDPSCAQCPSRLPSCVGEQNGYKEFPTRLWKSDFVRCFLNRTTEIDKCSSNEYFNPRLKQCMENVLPGKYLLYSNMSHLFSILGGFRLFYLNCIFIFKQVSTFVSCIMTLDSEIPHQLHVIIVNKKFIHRQAKTDVRLDVQKTINCKQL